MHVSVTPLQKTRSESYTYCAEGAEVGDIVQIELGTQKTFGIVRGPATVRTAKQAERIPGFSLTPTQYDLAEWLSDEYLTHPGIVFKQFAPPSRACLLPEHNSAKDGRTKQTRTTVRTLTSPQRIETYRSLIRGSRGPTLLLVPTTDHIEPLRQRVAPEALLYHSGLGASAQRKVWQEVARGGPTIVVGTRSALHLPWVSLSLIIVEGEESMGYKQDSQPRYHARAVAAKLAQLTSAELILGSSAPSLEAYSLARPTDDEALDVILQPVTPRREDGALSYRIWNALAEASAEDHVVAWIAPHLRSEAMAELKHITASGEKLPFIDFSPTLPTQFATLGIVVGIDPLLHLADFRASERVYEACRKTASLLLPGGTLYIQTNEAAHPMFEAITAPMDSFYGPELAERRALLLPPATRLTRILFTARSAALAERAAWAAKDRLGDLVYDVGPCTERKHGGTYRWQLLSKGDPKRLREVIDPKWFVDVDPVDLL